MIKKLCTVLAFTCVILSASAQNGDLGSWNLINIKYTGPKEWSFFGEAQLRSLHFYRDFHYYEYKGGIEYQAYPNIRVALAAGSYQTYKEGGDFVRPKNNDEFRLWPQFTIVQPIGLFKIEQRYRSEFRFTSQGFRQRFRQRIGISYAFGKSKRYQVSASNELFFTNKEPYFERNRIAFNLNCKVHQHVSLMLGYLHQFDYKINDETGRDFLQTGIYWVF